jgi:hypothetical protein
MLTVSRDVMLEELQTASSYLQKWIVKLNTQGIPGIDTPITGTSDEAFVDFIRELCGELRVVSGKCDSLSEVVLDCLLQSGG